MTLFVYTDGSASPNPGPGGAGVVYVKDSKVIKKLVHKGGETTNNRMELFAVIMSFKYINKQEETIIYTDSSYVQKGITDWIKKWIKNDWKTSNKKDVKNKDLWIKLHERLEKHDNVKIQWIKGHNSDKWNDIADELAKKGTELSKNK